MLNTLKECYSLVESISINNITFAIRKTMSESNCSRQDISNVLNRMKIQRDCYLLDLRYDLYKIVNADTSEEWKIGERIIQVEAFKLKMQITECIIIICENCLKLESLPEPTKEDTQKNYIDNLCDSILDGLEFSQMEDMSNNLMLLVKRYVEDLDRIIGNFVIKNLPIEEKVVKVIEMSEVKFKLGMSLLISHKCFYHHSNNVPSPKNRRDAWKVEMIKLVSSEDMISTEDKNISRLDKFFSEPATSALVH